MTDCQPDIEPARSAADKKTISLTIVVSRWCRNASHWVRRVCG